MTGEIIPFPNQGSEDSEELYTDEPTQPHHFADFLEHIQHTQKGELRSSTLQELLEEYNARLQNNESDEP